MSEEHLTVLVERLSSDEEFAAALGAADSADAVVALAADAGIVVTADELLTLAPASDREVSDVELEESAGGTGSSVYVCLPTQVLCTIRWMCG